MNPNTWIQVWKTCGKQNNKKIGKKEKQPYLRYMKVTNIQPQEVREMTDNNLIKHLIEFPYWSRWENKESVRIAEYRIALIQGNNYIRTGKIKSFTRI